MVASCSFCRRLRPSATAEVLPDGRLAIAWHPEGLVSNYHPGWVCRHRPESPAGTGLPPRRLWQAGLARLTPLVRVDGGALRRGDETALRSWLTMGGSPATIRAFYEPPQALPAFTGDGGGPQREPLVQGFLLTSIPGQPRLRFALLSGKGVDRRTLSCHILITRFDADARP